MAVIRSLLKRAGGARRLRRQARAITPTEQVERPGSNPADAVRVWQNDDPGEPAPTVSADEADRLRDAGQYQRAAEAYRALVERAPLHTGLRVQYGNMLKDSGRPEEAEAAYRAALEQTPDDADIHLQLGYALKQQFRHSVAVDAFRRAAELAPFAAEPTRELALLGDRPIATVDIGCGSRLRMLSIGDDVIAETYRTAGPRSFEPASLMVWFHLAKRSGYAIDVGAFTGIYALVAANANPLIKVAAFEPTKQVFCRLCLNIQLNWFHLQIAPLNFAVGDRLGDCTLNHHDGIYCFDSASTLLNEGGPLPVWYSEEVKMLPLDSLPALGRGLDVHGLGGSSAGDNRLTVIELPQTGPDIVKIDVEGYEIEVLAGMRQAIRESLPIFIIECLSPDRLRAVQDYLHEFSYIPLLIDEEKMSMISDVGEYRLEATRNVMFYPHSKQTVIEQIHNDSGITMRL